MYWVKKLMIFALVATPFVLLSTSFAKIKPESKKITVVCIDAGHGGKDPGCHGDYAKEKDVALAIALKFGKYIEDNYPDVKVVYTRKTDVFVELNERAAIANRNHADIFICIHCNSACVRKKGKDGKYHDVCNEVANGSATYVMGLHKLEGNLDVAKRENDAVLLEANYEKNYDLNINSDEAEIIYSAYQNEYLEESMRYAELCEQQFSSKAGRSDNGVKQAGFLVLWKTQMASVLIETGFLTNPQEEHFLASEKGQDHMAASIFRAFRTWKDEVEGNTVTYTDYIEKMKPYSPDAADTAGLRKPVNYCLTGGTKPKVDTMKVVVKPKLDSAKKDSTKDLPVKVTPPAPATVVYRVQIISSDKLLDEKSAQFKGITDTWHYMQNGMLKYTAGSYTSQADAIKRQGELKKQGFDQAFVVAFDNNGKRITLDEAKKIAGK
jgi:N-acetylmuramoyl-L-alanine amidase